MTAADALATAYTHGPGRFVEVGEPPPFTATPGHRVPLRDLAAQGPFGAAVAHLLTDVATPLRWEPWNQYNDHRGYPSARAAFTVDVELVAGPARLRLDPARRALVGVAAPAVADEVRLDLVRRRDRLSPAYHEFGDVLTELEVGHVAAALVEHAARLGLRAHAEDLTVVVRSHRETGDPVPPLPPRGSGFGPRGISADPRPLPEAALHAFVRAVTSPPPGSPTRTDLRHRLAVRNVVGLADGWYDLDLRPVAPGPALLQVREAFGHTPQTIDVAAMNLALVTTGSAAEAVAADGPGGYHALLRAAGAMAQHACDAAARSGMFCRPARSIHDRVLEAAVRAPASHQVLYLLAAGRPRGAGFTYDLTPLPAPENP
ncbi:hypothetical protein [Saccharothrix obliqua]|uniref:hypothetical protein n=1 Tax=Saccharothrix obliqua TaxID=2861747 RepID=UPI001C5D3F4A|nr:hypothetical protein [Saccharothrix obliqua]MBW4717784.1 hypothetical protein [Saccharothrix obliqua]